MRTCQPAISELAGGGTAMARLQHRTAVRNGTMGRPPRYNDQAALLYGNPKWHVLPDGSPQTWPGRAAT